MQGQDKAKAERASTTIAILKGKWNIHILLAMKVGPQRLSELRRNIPRATKKMLIESLQRLESSGLIRRTDLSGATKHVEYQVVDDLRETLFEIIGELGTLELSSNIETLPPSLPAEAEKE